MYIQNVLICITILLTLISNTYSLDPTDPEYLRIKNELLTNPNMKIIIELDVPELKIEKTIKPNTKNKKRNSIQTQKQKIDKEKKIQEYKNNISNKQAKTITKLRENNDKKVKWGKLVPFLAIEINSSNIDDLLSIPDIKTIYEDRVTYATLATSVPQIGADIAHVQGYEGAGQTIAILDTGFETAHDMLAGKIVSEACYSDDLCPGGFTATTAPGSSEACIHKPDCSHGTHVAGIALGDNGVGLVGVAPQSTLIAINVFSDTCGVDLCAYDSDIILGLERVLTLSSIYDISAVSMSLGGGSFAANCDAVNPLMTTAINNLRAVDIPTLVASGNDGYVASISYPACISTAISVGSVEDNSAVSGFSNSAGLVDLLAPGGSIFSSIVGNAYTTYAGTSMATPHIAGAWSVLKAANPTATTNEIFALLTSTGTPTTDAKNGVAKPLINMNLALDQIIIPNFTGGPHVLDVQIQEEIYEHVRYNPQKPGTGLFYDNNENQSIYIANGTITIINTHPTEAAENILLDLKNIQNIYNISYYSGRPGYYIGNDAYFLHLQIPDLGPGQTTTFRYDINTTSIPPALNFTSSYSNNRIMAGGRLNVYDYVQNNLNQTNYNTTCISNISIIQKTMPANVSGTLYNFTYNTTSLAGTDNANANFADNTTLNWNVSALNCLYPTNRTDINYLVNTPIQIDFQDHYDMINTSISYTFNNSISGLTYSRVRASIRLDLQFDKQISDMVTTNDATWEIATMISNPTNISVNLKKVSLWVSKRNSSGTGFTNPAIIDNDTISNATLERYYYPHMLLNDSTNYNNSGLEWMFNYTHQSSPIVWMTLENDIIDNDDQITDSIISFSKNSTYIKQIYVITGYYLEIFKNITKIGDTNYSVEIIVKNKGNSMTPQDQIVMVYNFIPNTFNLTSNFNFLTSTWYTTDNTSEILNDPIYNGTMHQFAITPTNIYNTSLDQYTGTYNTSNTWSVRFNVSGNGDFDYSDLFLTGLDPLHVDKYGSTYAVIVESVLGFADGSLEIIFAATSIIIALLLFFS